MINVVTKDYINELSKRLKDAVIKVLNLDENEEIFIGNEEKLFLLNVLDKTIPGLSFDGSSKAAAKSLDKDSTLKNTQDHTIYKMLDIFEAEINIKKNHSLFLTIAQKIKYWVMFSKSILLLMKLQTIVHSQGYFKNDWFVIEELSKVLLKYDKKNITLRNQFRDELLQNGIEKDLALNLANLFPISHLESYKKIKAHPFNKLSIKKVISNIYGIMADPLIGSMIRQNKSEIIYLQHGGGYGLKKDRLQYQLEEEGCSQMLYWGTGNKNVFPTRYRKIAFSRINPDVLIILSANKNIDSNGREFYISKANEIKKNYNSDVVIVPYPQSNSRNFNYSNLKFGISHKTVQKAKLVIFDSVGQSLLFARIISKRPFLIINEFPLDIDESNHNAMKFVNLLRECKLLIDRSELLDQSNYWTKTPSEVIEKTFIHQASPFLDHVLNQPTINDIFFRNKF